MFIDLLWLIYYRLQCMRVTINAVFYFFITFKPLVSLDNVVRLALWIIMFIVMTPFELMIAIAVDTFTSLGVATEACIKMR